MAIVSSRKAVWLKTTHWKALRVLGWCYLREGKAASAPWILPAMCARRWEQQALPTPAAGGDTHERQIQSKKQRTESRETVSSRMSEWKPQRPSQGESQNPTLETAAHVHSLLGWQMVGGQLVREGWWLSSNFWETLLPPAAFPGPAMYSPTLAEQQQKLLLDNW